MKLELKNFRCHRNRIFEFEDGKLILLKGASGTGKSTILNAIYWILYGKLRSVTSFNSTGKTSCRLSIGNIEIYRQKNPNLLQLSIASEEEVSNYEDDVAQNIINQMFSDEKIWYISSYIHQKHTNPLLSSNNRDATDYLNLLSFQNENPETIVKNLDEYIKSQQQLLLKQNTSLEVNKRIFTESYPHEPDDVSNIDQVELNSALELLKKECQVLNKQIQEHRDSMSKKTVLEEQKLNIISNIPSPDLDDLSQLQKKRSNVIEILTNMEKNYHKYQEYSELKSKYNAPEIDVSAADLQVIYHEERTYQSFVEACKLLGIDGKIENIETRKKQLESEYKLIEEQESAYNEWTKWEPQRKKQSETITKINKLKAELQELDSHVNNPDIESEIKKLSDKFREAELSTFIRKCPSCGKNLRMIAGQLELVHNEIIPSEEVPKIRQQLSTLKSQQEMQTQRSQKKAQITYQLQHLSESLIEIPNIKFVEKKDWKKLKTEYLNKISKINSLKVVNPPRMSYARAKIAHDASVVCNQLKTFPEEVRLYDVSKLQELRKELASLNERILQIQRDIDKKEHLTPQLETLEYQLSKLIYHPGAELKYDTLSKEIKLLEINLEKYKYSINYQKQFEEIQQCDNEIKITVENIKTAESVRIKTLNLHHAFLETVVYNINTRTNELLACIFNKPIIFNISMFKENKKESYLKPKFNITIQYNGCEYTNYEMLSGGEEDRISIALTLAIASMSNSPWILLDESFKFIDGELREKCLEALRNLSSQYGVMKCVLAVSHEDTEGYYDDVVDIEN